MHKVMIAAALATVLVAPALAQSSTEGAVSKPLDPSLQMPKGKVPTAPGLPGVGDPAPADAGVDSQAGEPKGAGGLQNGVGGEGTLAPSTTGSNDDILDTPAETGLPLKGPGVQ